MSVASNSISPADLQGRRRSRPFLTAQWRHLVMLSWPIDPSLLAPLVPRGVELDFFQGETFVSLVAFLFRDTRLRGIPIPFHRTFAEVNLRFYVKRECQEEIRRGVMFVKEIVPLHAVTWVARTLYHENYVTLRMRHNCPPGEDVCAGARFGYDWRSDGRWHRIDATARSGAQPRNEGSLEQFIAEHYWGYSTTRHKEVIEYEVRHPAWKVAPLAGLELECDFAGLYGAPFAGCLTGPPVSAFVADGSAVEIFPGQILPA